MKIISLFSLLAGILIFSIPLLLHFLLVLTKTKQLARLHVLLGAGYIPAFIFFIIGLKTDLLNIWILVIIGLEIYICTQYYRQLSNPNTRNQTKYVMISFSGLILLFISPSIFKFLTPIELELITLGFVFQCCCIGIGIWKHGLFKLTPKTAAENILDTMSDYLILVNPDGRIASVNQSLLETLDYEKTELIDKDAETVFASKDDKDQEFKEKIIVGKSSFRDFEMFLKTKTGERIPVSVSRSIIQGEHGSINGIVFIGRDITVRKKMENQLTYLANHDSLTNLLNRKSFYEYLNNTIALAEILDEHKGFGLLFIDLDLFKNVNDSFGHDIGDLTLKETAERLGKICRKSDYIFRLSGDEFIVILPNCYLKDDIRIVVQKILDELSKAYYVGGHEIFVGASIGISVFPKDAKDAETLLKVADTALYQSKKSRNAFTFYS